MDSHKFLGGSKGGGYSKAQMCFQKILGIIRSVPPPYQQISKAKPYFLHRNLLQLDSSPSLNSQDKDDQSFDIRGFLIDLNSELTSPPETEETNKSLAIDQDDSSSQEKKGNPVSEKDIEDDQKREMEPFCSREEEEGGLALLIETGEEEELSSPKGELELHGRSKKINDKESAKKGREKRGVYVYGGFDGEEVPEVVRTKRGRLLVLPCRYKDSVMQPLERNVVPTKRHRLR